MRIEEITEQAKLAALRDRWRQLVDRSPHADIFQTYEWVTSWLGCFWKDRPIAFLFAWEGEQLVAIAPLVNDKNGAISCRNSLSLPVNSHARRLDILCSGDASAVLEAMIDHLRQSGRTVRLTLRQSRDDSPMSRALPDVAKRLKMASMELPSRTCPIVRIESTWDDYLITRPKQVQRELKRKLRKIEREWKADWIIASTPADCSKALADVWQIERKSWKEHEGTSLTAEQESVRLYEEFAPRFASEGWLRIYLLHLNGAPAAHILGAEFHGEYFALKTSYDSAFRQASPGQALFFVALRDAFQRKLTAFDFLGDESRWKNELANAERKHVSVCAHAKLDARCIGHTLLEQQLKPLAKEYAPGLVALRRRLLEPVHTRPLPPTAAPDSGPAADPG